MLKPKPSSAPAPARAAKDVQAEIDSAGDLMLEFERFNRPGSLQAALRQAGEAMASDPASKDAWLVLGRGRDAMGNYLKARQVYARALSINPAAIQGYRLTAQTWLPDGKLEQAQPWLIEAQKRNPDDLLAAASLLQLAHTLEDYPAAEYWSEWIERRVTRQPAALAALAVHHYLTGNFQRAIQYGNIARRLGLDVDWQADAIFTRIKRDEAIATGQYTTAIKIISDRHPSLVSDPPQIVPGNVAQAVDLAYLKNLAGEKPEAERLLNLVLKAYDQPLFTAGSARAAVLPARAEALALLGHPGAAMAELRRIVDQGWRVMWRWETELNANFIALREDSAFRALIRRLEDDVTAQRARIARSAARVDHGQALANNDRRTDR
jgi:tetratricopeptide (TPR) repeat protein